MSQSDIELVCDSVTQQIQEQSAKYGVDAELSGYAALTRTLEPAAGKWTLTSLGEVVLNIVGGGTPSKNNLSFFSGTIPFMTVKDMNKLRPLDTVDHITKEAVENSSTRIIPSNTPLVATRMSLGKIVRTDFDVAINQDLKAIFLSSKVDVDYFEFWYRSIALSIEAMGIGTTVKGINLKQLNALELPLPPLVEQQQIAAKLDELLAQVDTLKTRLDTIPKILKRFRQSVLAAAVSGKLTEDWRGRNNDSSWQEQRLEDVCLSISDGDHQAPPRAKNGIPFLVISNISKGKLDFENVERWVPEDYYQSLKAVRIPMKNDILYTVTGSFGIPVIVDTDESFCFQRHIAIIKPNHEVVNFKFVQIILGSIQGLKQAESVATGTAQKTVSLKGLRNFVFEFPLYKEQTEIVLRVEQLFTYADQIEQRVKDAQSRVNHLSQSILAKAFRGELTADWREQNPDLISGENSAEALLARIKEERQLLGHNKVTNRGTIKKSGEIMKPKGISPIIETLKTAGN